MNNITRMIYRKIREIALCIFMIIATFFINDAMNHSAVFKLLEMEKPTSLAYVDMIRKEDNNLYVAEDQASLDHIKPISVQMVNDTYLETTYALGMKVSKNSTIDYNDLKIAYLDKIVDLKELFVGEDATHNYFLLERGDLTASSKTYEIKLWIDKKGEMPEANNTFQYEFMNLENIAF